MPRQPRVAFPGARYHVIGRGNRRQQVFFEAEDYLTFLGMAADALRTFEVQLFCYSLMPNHFHVHLCTPHGNISRFMHSLLTSYAGTITRKRNLPGHLFQNRFWARIAEPGLAGARLSRYIHLNPCAGKDKADLPPEVRRKILHTYPWSSFGALIGERPCPSWLARDEILGVWDGDLPRREQTYRQFVEQGIESSADLSEEVGDLPDVDRLADHVLSGLQAGPAADQHPTSTEAPHPWASLDEIVAAVAAVFRVGAEDLLRPRSRVKSARRALLYLVARHCRGAMPLETAARALGVTASALRAARDRIGPLLASVPGFHGSLEAVERCLEAHRSAGSTGPPLGLGGPPSAGRPD